MIAYILTPAGLTLSFSDGSTLTVPTSHINFQRITEELAINPNDEDAIRELGQPMKALEKSFAKLETEGFPVIEITESGIKVNDLPIGGRLSEKALEMVNLGLPLDPFMRFAQKLFNNSSFVARNEFLLFSETNDLPIHFDGDILAYKKVGADYFDLHSHTLDYSPGNVVEMDRGDVDDDRRNLCSYGLHFCSKSYLPHFGSSSGNKIVLVKINPADIVSIPADYANAKGRTSRMEVLKDVTALYADQVWGPVYNDDDDGDDDSRDFFEDDDVLTLGAEVVTLVELDEVTSGLTLPEDMMGEIVRDYGDGTFRVKFEVNGGVFYAVADASDLGLA